MQPSVSCFFGFFISFVFFFFFLVLVTFDNRKNFVKESAPWWLASHAF